MSSWRIGTISNVPVYFHWTMGLLPILVLLRGYFVETTTEILIQLSLVFALYACLIFHEAGHVLLASLLKLPVRDVTLYPLGGSERLAQLSECPWQEMWVSLAGPVVHALIAAAISLFCIVAEVPLSPRNAEEPFGEIFWHRLFWVNVLLVVLQLIPAFPLDGGRFFRAALALSAGRLRATEVSALLSSFVAIAMLVVGMIWIDHIWGVAVMGLGVIVHLSGQQELMRAYFFASLQNEPSGMPPNTRPIQAPIDQVLDEDAQPGESNFSGFTWSGRTRLWIEWRDGIAIAANALIGE